MIAFDITQKLFAIAAVLIILLFAIRKFINSTDKEKSVLYMLSLPTTIYTGNLSASESLQLIYNAIKKHKAKLAENWIIFATGVVIADLDLIKRIFITDWSYFTGRGFYYNARDDPLSANIIRLDGETWRRLRSKLTPTFTSGKIKYMFPTLVDIGQRFVDVFDEETKTVSIDEKGFEIRDITARFTTDAIGNIAFGIECNSLRNPTTEFRVFGDRAFTDFNPLLEIICCRFADFLRSVGFRIYSNDHMKFYSKIIADNIAYRECNNIRRHDFLDILIELKNKKLDDDVNLTVNECVAQAFAFFIGGFEASSNTITYTLYELSKNQEIQDLARRDILQAFEAHNQQFTYECLKDMLYLERVLMESLRKYPVFPNLKRVADSDYDVPGTSYKIRKGYVVAIPVYAIHHDPDYYPEPEKFNPDNFLPYEIQKRPPMTYLPFGAGPRTCIAERYGKIKALVALALLLKNFQFTVGSATPEKLKFNTRNVISLSVEDGIWLKVKRI